VGIVQKRISEGITVWIFFSDCAWGVVVSLRDERRKDLSRIMETLAMSGWQILANATLNVKGRLLVKFRVFVE